MRSELGESFSAQYGLPCVDVENPDTANADSVIQFADLIGAVRSVDGVEYCVAMRDVGPELWTEEALRRSCKGS